MVAHRDENGEISFCRLFKIWRLLRHCPDKASRYDQKILPVVIAIYSRVILLKRLSVVGSLLKYGFRIQACSHF